MTYAYSMIHYNPCSTLSSTHGNRVCESPYWSYSSNLPIKLTSALAKCINPDIIKPSGLSGLQMSREVWIMPFLLFSVPRYFPRSHRPFWITTSDPQRQFRIIDSHDNSVDALSTSVIVPVDDLPMSIARIFAGSVMAKFMGGSN